MKISSALLLMVLVPVAAGAQYHGGSRSKGGVSYGRGRSKVVYTPGTILIANRSGGPVHVFKQDVELALVAAGQQTLLRDVAGGPQRLVATSADRSRAWEVEVFIGRDDEPRWVVDESEGKAGIVLRNYTKDELHLSLESRPQLRAAVGASAIYYVESAVGKPLRATVESASGRLKYPGRFLTFASPSLQEWRIGTAPAPGAAPVP